MYDRKSLLKKEHWPQGLFEIPQKPKKLFYRGKFPEKYSHKFLCIVGSRKHSSYATEAVIKLISGLKNRNIVIVSGLAIGIDTLAHKHALENNLKTIAVLGNGVEKESIYPRSNQQLSEKILDNGCLISEFENETPQIWSFPARNRIMVGISDAVLVIEADEKSGTLITARMALDYNKELLTVPTTIFSNYGKGSNKLLREGAKPVFCSEDILEELGLPKEAAAPRAAANLNKNEKSIIKMLKKEINTFDEIVSNSDLDPSSLSQILMEMEIKGFIIKTLGKYESLI